MITEYMELATFNDARQWANECGDDLTNEQIQSLAQWIWDNKPQINCTYAEHPLSSLDADSMWKIIG